MFLADASTKRPVAVSCLLIALTFLGLNSYRKISVEMIPKVDIPYVSITTTWPGASPADLEKDVAKKIEDAVSGLDGV
ncbi:MAG: efflux RND transporter permease subunit, partial [Victivallales bacterium]|nr:efflux RND transporter permease subunit [Victivallales bacterium]